MRQVRINLLRRARASLDAFVMTAGTSASERLKLRKAVIESTRTCVAESDGFPPRSTPDETIKIPEARWFECEPAYLVLAVIVRTTIGKRFFFIPEVVLDVTVIDFNFSPDLLLRRI